MELKSAFSVTHKEINSIFENMLIFSNQMKTPVKVVLFNSIMLRSHNKLNTFHLVYIFSLLLDNYAHRIIYRMEISTRQ